MNNKKILTGIFMSIFLISLASALTFKQNEQVDIKIICINAGYCTTSAVCNVSVFSPSEVTLLNGIQATRAANLAFHNFTLNGSQMSDLGQYRVGGFCKDGSVTQLVDFNFDVTANGEPFEAFPNQFVIIGLAFILIIFGFFKDRLRMLKHMGSMILMIMGVLTLYPGYNFINHTTLLGLALGLISIGIGFYFLIEDSFSRNKQEDTFESQSHED